MTTFASYWWGRLTARLSRWITLRVAFVLMTLSTLLSGVAALSAIHASVEVRREVQRSEAERCKVTLLSRQGSLDKDLRIFTRLGHAVHASQGQIDVFLNGIRDDYAALPVPADCR